MKRVTGSPYFLGLLVALLALLIRLHRLDWGLPDIYEEATSIQKAWGFWGWGGGGLDFNPRFFNYPSLYFYLQFGVQALLRLGGRLTGAFPDGASFQAAYVLEPGVFLFAGRLLTALLASTTVFVLYATGLRMGGRRIAVVAAVALAVHAVHVQKSRFVEVDVAATFFATLATFYLVRYAGGGKSRDIHIAAGAIGFAAATKYPGAFFLIGLPVAEVFREGAFRHRRVALSLLVAACVFAVATPYVLLDFASFLRDFGAEGVHMREGHFGGSGGGVFGALLLFAQGFGWPLFLVAVAGLALAAARPAGLERLLVPLPLLFFALLSTSRMQAPHYTLPVVPLLALLAAVCLDRAIARFGARRGPLHAVAACALLVWPAIDVARADMRLGGPDARTLAREWIEKHVPSGALVLLEPHGPNLRSSNEIARYAERREHAAVRDRVVPVLKQGPWYRTAVLPSFSIDPERSARFYRIEPFQWFEYVVLSNQVFGRYRADPKRYAAECAFHDALRSRYDPIARFASGGEEGPRIEILARGANAPPLPGLRLDPAGAGDDTFELYFRSVADLYEERGLVGEAAVLYGALLDIDPGDTETILRLALLAGARGDLSGAIGLLEGGLRIDPGNRRLRMNLGVLLCQAGRGDAGIVLFEDLLRQREEADVHGNLATALLQQGRVDEAAFHLRRFLELEPGHAQAVSVRQLLQSLGSDRR